MIHGTFRYTALPPRDLRTYYYNVVENLDGTISRLPFDSKKYGIWKFDGQIYWMPKRNKL